jgi:hypothetical protein
MGAFLDALSALISALWRQVRFEPVAADIAFPHITAHPFASDE